MKKTMTLLALALSLAPLAQAQDTLEERQRRAQRVNLFYQQAYQAYQDGDITEARKALQNVFRLSPNHPQAYALKLKLNSSGNQIKIQQRKRQLSKVIIPQIDFDEMELGLALQTLNKLIMKQSKNKITPNFVIQDKSGTLKNKKVTLEVRNFPATEALRFLTEATNSTAVFSEYAITIRPRGQAKPAPAPKPVKKEPKDPFDD